MSSLSKNAAKLNKCVDLQTNPKFSLLNFDWYCKSYGDFAEIKLDYSIIIEVKSFTKIANPQAFTEE